MLTKDRARVIVWAYSTDTDTWGLAEDLYGVLRDSGWTMNDSMFKPQWQSTRTDATWPYLFLESRVSLSLSFPAHLEKC